MSAAPWKKYNRLQEIAERYEISTDELLHLASQGGLTLYGCLPSGVRLRKGLGGEFISAQFVRFNQGDAQELELRGKVTLSQFDTAVSVIDGVCIEHDSVGRQLDGLVSRFFNRFSTNDGKPVTFERNDIFLIHERNMAEILRDDLWRSSVLDIDAPSEYADTEPKTDDWQDQQEMATYAPERRLVGWKNDALEHWPTIVQLSKGEPSARDVAKCLINIGTLCKVAGKQNTYTWEPTNSSDGKSKPLTLKTIQNSMPELFEMAATRKNPG